MSAIEQTVYSLVCNGCEETYESTWDNTWFEAPRWARDHSIRDGWYHHGDWDFCKGCTQGQHRFRGRHDAACVQCGAELIDHWNPDKIPVILPGQIPLIGVR